MTGLLIAAGALLALLAIPLTLTFQVAWPDVPRSKAEVTWAFGLLRKHITPAAQRRDEAARGDTRERTARARRPRSAQSGVLKALGQREFRDRILRFASDLWHAVHKRDVRLRLRVGLGDPADTGQLWGFLGPMAGLLGSVREIAIVLEPEFEDEVLEFDGDGCVRVVPLRLILLFIALMLSPALWRGIRRMRLARA